MDMGEVKHESLKMSATSSLAQKAGRILGEGSLFLITSASLLAVLFIFYFIGNDAIPFFQMRGFTEFFTSPNWYPSNDNAEFGCQAIFYGSFMVTAGAILVATPLGVAAAVCLSDVLPFSARQYVKPVIEVLAAIPSVAYGFFALVVFAPLLQTSGGKVLAYGWYFIAVPFFALTAAVLSDTLTTKISNDRSRQYARNILALLMLVTSAVFVWKCGILISGMKVDSGTNALNVSIILGIMTLPTIVSVSEDSLQAVGRELREGSYALGATRAETLVKTIIPAASSGIMAAILLGVMRAIGETMVLWMASGNAAKIPAPLYNFLEPVRTLTATIAGDMGEADHVTGSERYAVLFAMGLCLLVFSFGCNLASEWVVRRQVRKLRGG